MKKVLVAPLDWGLGHATRCIPVIRELLRRGCEVSIAGSGISLQLLKKEFSDLQAFTLPGYEPEYPTKSSMVFKMLTQLPKFVNVISNEHEALKKIVQVEKIQGVISDNRYGCWSAEIPSVLITHQSNILMSKRFGWLGPIVRKINVKQMSRFSLCWIPDSPENPLAGELGSFGNLPKQIHFKHVGHLTRFSRGEEKEKRFDVAVIFSGPEPQRSILESIVVPQLQRSSLRHFVVRGVAGLNSNVNSNVADFLTSADLQEVIDSSDVVLSRSGYSTVMDLAALQKKAIFIPTPGQTEQEYLAKRLCEMKIAFYMPQDLFNLEEAIRQSKSYSGFKNYQHREDLLKSAVDHFLSQ